MRAELSRVETIFDEAIAIAAPDERAAFLDRACADDSDLRQRVEALLAAHDAAEDLLRLPYSDRRLEAFPVVSEGPGTTIGRYKLLEQIGEGGFGVVFMAEQQHPVRRKVALKVIKLGMDTRQVIARFAAERQALAMMDHPNIARVFDAGATETGRPYFVMELVRGIPITDYCDQNKLSTRERLELFLTVCSAVQHAHTKGIIHRDIKPTNVLVTLHEGVAAPKVIDFGVAKATGQQLTDKTLFTNFAQMIGTPLYMSPEQAEMTSVDVDTRSDIYSLGVLLYELLTGTTPLDKDRLKRSAFDEIRRILREEEPPRPSARLSTVGEPAQRTVAAQRGTDPKRLGRLVRGELDWIVMKALEKERARRYETASGMARDVERYLKDETVEACPPSTWYRLQKLARRNKSGLAAAALVLFLLASLGGVAGWVALQRAAQRKALETDISRALDEVREFCQKDRLREATAVLDQVQALAARGGAEEELSGRVAGLRKDVDMATHLEALRLGNAAAIKAEHADGTGTTRYTKAFREYGLDPDQPDPDKDAARIEVSAIREQLIAAMDDWLVALSGQDRERLLALLALADPDPWRRQLRVAFVNKDLKALRDLAADATAPLQPPATALLLWRTLSELGESELAVEFLRRAQHEYRGDFWLNENLGLSLITLEPPRPVEAVGYLRAAVALRPYSSEAIYNLGFALQQQRDLPGAIAAFEKAIELKPHFASAHMTLGYALHDQGDLPAALIAHQKVIALQPSIPGHHYNLGNVLHQQRDLPAAVVAYRKAIALKPDYALAHFTLGDVLQEQGEFEALEVLRRGYELTLTDTRWRDRSAQRLLKLARSYIHWRQRDKAAADRVMAELWARPSPEFLDQINREAYILRRDGEPAQARELRARVVDGAKILYPPGNARLVKYQHDYLQLLLQMQLYNEAEAVAGSALKSLPSGETASRLVVLQSLANLYELWNKPREAERYRELVNSAKAATQSATTQAR